MDEFKALTLTSILIVLSTLVFTVFLAFTGGQESIIKFSKYSIILPVIITLLAALLLAEDFKISLLYGALLGLVFITSDALVKSFYGLSGFNLSLNNIIVFLVIFVASSGIGSRFGIVKKALDEIRSEKAD